jgi:hypothetical protein
MWRWREENDFGFSILDFGLAKGSRHDPPLNPKSKIENPKWM